MDLEFHFTCHTMVFIAPKKSTTKMRTVFNASSPSTSGKSLNSIQFNGGLVQEDLFSIMVRFRKHKYAFTTDIEKMFRMINIHPEQTCLQRILWKKGIGEPIKTYELTTVTYGTVSAPYLATRTLKQLAMDEANNFPLEAPVLLSDCYMDDILSGSEYRRGNRIAASINRNVQDRRDATS
ncbi:integrase catalytic domain-containing protein [Trichonephila clavipes]|nr:integrase catalytic domain-containing protein [Trichonephila clavipes]